MNLLIKILKVDDIHKWLYLKVIMFIDLHYSPLVYNGPGVGTGAAFSAAFLSPESVFRYNIQKFCNPPTPLLVLHRVGGSLFCFYEINY